MSALLVQRGQDDVEGAVRVQHVLPAVPVVVQHHVPDVSPPEVVLAVCGRQEVQHAHLALLKALAVEAVRAADVDGALHVVRVVAQEGAAVDHQHGPGLAQLGGQFAGGDRPERPRGAGQRRLAASPLLLAGRADGAEGAGGRGRGLAPEPAVRGLHRRVVHRRLAHAATAADAGGEEGGRAREDVEPGPLLHALAARQGGGQIQLEIEAASGGEVDSRGGQHLDVSRLRHGPATAARYLRL